MMMTYSKNLRIWKLLTREKWFLEPVMKRLTYRSRTIELSNNRRKRSRKSLLLRRNNWLLPDKNSRLNKVLKLKFNLLLSSLFTFNISKSFSTSAPSSCCQNHVCFRTCPQPYWSCWFYHSCRPRPLHGKNCYWLDLGGYCLWTSQCCETQWSWDGQDYYLGRGKMINHLLIYFAF